MFGCWDHVTNLYEMKYERKDLKPLKIEQMYVIVCYTYLAIRRRADGCQELTCTSPDDERKRTVAIRGAIRGQRRFHSTGERYVAESTRQVCTSLEGDCYVRYRNRLV